MMLCKIVPQVLGGRSPTFIELLLLCAVAHPIEPHIYCFATLLFACSAYDTVRGCVVSMYGSGRLWVTHFPQDVPNVDSFLRI
jgi:hypothetical protein